MANVLMQLQYTEFPECTKEALNFLVHNYSDPPGRLPAHGAPGENLAMDVALQYIVDVARRKGHKFKKLNAVHELQLLEMVCSTLQEAPEHARYSVFSAIFGRHVDAVKISLLTRLVSMSISVSCGPVLGCVAIWMQEQGSQSQCVCDMAQRLVEDFCLLFPNISPAFKRLPSVSTLFTCNFVTALTTIFTYTDGSKVPPTELLECVVDWISADPCLCSDSVRLVRIRSNFTCPIGGLVRWCILGPLVTLCEASETRSSSTVPDTSVKGKANLNDKLMTLFSKLHLAVLLSLDAYKSMELNEYLLVYADLFAVSKTLSAFYNNGHCTPAVLEAVNTAIDRLAQTVQVALTTRSLSEEIDLNQVCKGLPSNRLLQMIISARYSRRPRQQEAMDMS